VPALSLTKQPVTHSQAAEPQVLVDAELEKKRVFLRRVGDARGDDAMGRPGCGVLPEKLDRAGAAAQQANECLQER
jgi:hypothetical protein